MSEFVQAVAYTASAASSSHTVFFSPTQVGSRVVVLVHSYAGVTGISSGYLLHEHTAHTLGIRLYSKVSSGGDTSVTVNTGSSTDRIFMWMYEISNAPIRFGSATGLTSGSAGMSLSGLPAGCVAVLGVSHYVTGSTDNSSVSWPPGFTHRGYAFRDWSDSGLAKRVWAAGATERGLSGAFVFSQDLVTGDTRDTAWVGAVFGPNPDADPPTVPGNVRLTGMTNTSVTVAWDASTDSGVGVSRYGVYRDGTLVGEEYELTSTVEGLTAGQTYLIGVDAVDGNGNRSEKASVSVTVIADTAAPAVPGGLRITALGAGSFSLAWDASTDNIGVVGYGVYRNGAKVGDDQTTLTKAFSGLVNGSAHTVEVDAVDMHGNRSAKVSIAVVAAPDTTPPTVPGNLRTTAVSGASIAIAWNASTDATIGLAGYGVYKDGVKIGSDVTALAYRFNALTEDQTYLLAVDAVDRAGNRSAKASLSVQALTETVPPTTPGSLAVTGVTHTTISLAWTASTDNDEVIRYDVLVDGVRRGDTAGLAYTVAELVPNTGYLLAVRAVDRSGNVSVAATAAASTAEPPYLPIATPVYLLGAWAGNVADNDGVRWVVEEEEGWSSSAEVVGLGDDHDGDDGGFSGPGRFAGKVITLAGTAAATDHAAMARAMDRLPAVLHPDAQAELRVVEAHLTRRAMVRLSDQVRITPRGSLAFGWEFTVAADDPRRYGTPIRREATGEAPQAVEVDVEVYGDYPDGIPATLTVQDAIAAPRLLHVQTGVQVTFDPAVIINPGYAVRVDLLAREVTVFNPALPAGQQTVPGMRSMIASSTWFQLVPGLNTIRLLGQPHPTTPGPATLVADTADCWT
ncbi:hypothetical protein GCM10017673_38230 [Streptosporangium violaceochromogenes]|nr:hypothetical protein GCM10017673_38230 [Streptosporangium violaceochromogenes]